MSIVFVDGVEYVRKKERKTPDNKLNATHWAEAPNGNFLFYKIGAEILMWLPYAGVWEKPEIVPYTLHHFDE